MSNFSADRSAGYLASQMARLFAIGLHRRIAPEGLAPAQYMALLELWEEDGLTQSVLMQRLDIEQATMANTLARMERDGLITRRPHPQDGRARSVWLTDRARALREPAAAAALAQNDEALAGLSEQERAQFIDMMRRVIAALRRDR